MEEITKQIYELNSGIEKIKSKKFSNEKMQSLHVQLIDDIDRLFQSVENNLTNIDINQNNSITILKKHINEIFLFNKKINI